MTAIIIVVLQIFTLTCSSISLNSAFLFLWLCPWNFHMEITKFCSIWNCQLISATCKLAIKLNSLKMLYLMQFVSYQSKKTLIHLCAVWNINGNPQRCNHIFCQPWNIFITWKESVFQIRLLHFECLVSFILDHMKLLTPL